MINTLFRLSATLAFAACATLASATCTPPAKAGAVICFPTTNATVVFPMNIEGAATGENGLPITKMILYSNNVKLLEKDNSDTIYLVMDENDYFNQSYNLVLNAWDSGGNLLQYSANVTQVGGYYPCTHPASGINFCSPPNGSYQPNSFLQLAAYASSDVTSMNTWQNGKFLFSSNGNVTAANMGSATVSNAWQSFTVKAYKGSRALYTATSRYKPYYGCPGLVTGCAIYIQIQQPSNYQDLNSPFTVQAQAVQNPKPITSMKVYLDNTVVATSTGATIVSTVTAAAGTHLLTVQAWDTTGTLYKTQQTVNVY